MERAPEAVRTAFAQVDAAVVRNELLPGTRLWWAELHAPADADRRAVLGWR